MFRLVGGFRPPHPSAHDADRMRRAKSGRARRRLPGGRAATPKAAPCNCQGCVLLLGAWQIHLCSRPRSSGRSATSARRRTVQDGRRLPASGDQPQAIDELEQRLRQGRAGRGAAGATGTASPHAGGERSSSGRPGDAPTRRWRRSCQRAEGFFRTTRSSTSAATTTTTSPRRTSRRPTPTSRRTPRSTRTWSGCAHAGR